MPSLYSHLECVQCYRQFDKNQIHSFCPDCNQPLLARYDFSSKPDKSILTDYSSGMWRYKSFLPIEHDVNIVTLGEGWTPFLNLVKTSKKTGIQKVWLKDEGGNPTGSFKARGIGMAVSKAKELGLNQFCIPTAGNAGSALAAYAAAADGKAFIFMPEATPAVFQMDCEVMGAKVTKVKGSIRDAGLAMSKENEKAEWWDITTLKEPFRLEGKKTMGYEIAEQLNWKLPDVIIYPTGGGTGLIGIWKAFEELLELGWISEIKTRMVAIQTAGCNPVTRAFQENKRFCELYENPAETIANGLRVPKAFGDKLIMKTLYDSHGYALDVTEQEMMDAISEFGRSEGIFLSPEGAAVYAGMQKLVEMDWIKKSEEVVMINTGSPYKYIENLTF
ncbi:MAG: threonine synthase [Saprospiraceae bacterium]|nr:threonine synthase [Saprospiraceae bacterium]